MFRPFVPNRPPPRAEPDHANPRVTFGVEMEFCFAIRKTLYEAFNGGQAETQPNNSAEDAVVKERLRYVLALLNRSLPGSSQEPSHLGALTIEDPKVQNVDRARWHITTDASVEGRPSAAAEEFGITVDVARSEFIHLGGELVSPILALENLDSSVRAQLEQIKKDMRWDGHRGVYFTTEASAHVHVAFADVEIPLRTAQNLLALYGIFEEEIEAWHPEHKRENEYCNRLRRAMRMRTPKIYYTPQEFTDRIYATTSMAALRAEVFDGDSGPAIDAAGSTREVVLQDAKFVTVHVSLPIPNKMQTMEFRQHCGTVDPVELRCWVLFCASLFRYSHMLTQTGQRVQDVAPMGARNSFLKTLTDQSILEVIGFPAEGRVYFNAKVEQYKDFARNMDAALEKRVIEERIVRRAAGRQTGDAMENNIKGKKWYKDARAEIDKADAEAEFARENAERLKRGEAALPAEPEPATVVNVDSPEVPEPFIPRRPPPPPPAGPPLRPPGPPAPPPPPQSSRGAVLFGTVLGIWSFFLHWISGLTSPRPNNFAWLSTWFSTWFSYYFMDPKGRRFSWQDLWLIITVVFSIFIAYGILRWILGGGRK